MFISFEEFVQATDFWPFKNLQENCVQIFKRAKKWAEGSQGGILFLTQPFVWRNDEKLVGVNDAVSENPPSEITFANEAYLQSNFAVVEMKIQREASDCFWHYVLGIYF